MNHRHSAFSHIVEQNISVSRLGALGRREDEMRPSKSYEPSRLTNLLMLCQRRTNRPGLRACWECQCADLPSLIYVCVKVGIKMNSISHPNSVLIPSYFGT